MNSMKKQKGMILKDELPSLVGAQYATGDQWRNNSRKNEEMEPKQKQHPVVDVTGDVIVVSVCLPSDALAQCLPSYWGFSDLGRGVSPHGHCS